MILERAILPIKPGQAKDFEAAFAKARPLIEAAKGFQRLEMRRGIETPDSYLLLVW
ncbi:MAG TPA: antibiotic biosynthesis monooxygenase [Rhizomicrobium sp.]